MFFKSKVIFFFAGIFSMSVYASDSAVLSMTNVLDINLNKTKLTFLTEKYGMKLAKLGFHPTKVGCLTFNQANKEITVTFINSWSYPDRIGRYSVSNSEKSEKCTTVSDVRISEIYLGYNKKQLIDTFGSNYKLGVHDDESYREDGIYGKKYIQFSIDLPIKEVTIINPDDKVEKKIPIESSVIAEFTFDDAGFVKYYFVGYYEEPSPD